MSQKYLSQNDELNVTIGVNQPGYHAIDATVLAESLQGLSQLAQEVNTSVNGRSIELSVKILSGFKEGSFDFKALLDIAGGILPMAQQIIDIFKQVIEYRRFLGGKPPVKQEEMQDDGRIQITNHDGMVNTFQNCVINIGDTSQATRAIQKLFTPLAHDAGQIKISGGSPDFAPVIATQADRRSLLEPEDIEHKNETMQHVLENESERILMIRKPDFLGESKWIFSFAGRHVPIAIDDRNWLAKFQAGQIDIRPGDALKVKMSEKDYYNQSGEVTKVERSIQEVLALIRPSSQIPLI